MPKYNKTESPTASNLIKSEKNGKRVWLIFKQYFKKIMSKYRAARQPIKSDKDICEYRSLELSNGLKVLLISDPTAGKSAASLCVNAGSMSDPEDLPGLAHFCEHLLFMGTKKFPGEIDFQNFLNLHNGIRKAVTGTDYTQYVFTVNSNFLGDALDRFCQLFLEPLFTESAIEREIKAVHSEFEISTKSYFRIISQVQKATANPDHGYSKFCNGNMLSLKTVPESKGIDVRQELIAFHKKWYSSNIMTLAVLGKQSLDELAKMVEPLFTQVENKGVEIPTWPFHPFGPEQLKKQILIVPTNAVNTLVLTFPMPDIKNHYKSRPGEYLASLIHHRGRGSLLNELHKQSWVSSLNAQYILLAAGIAVIYIIMEVTNEGLDHVDDIVLTVFQFVEMLRREGPQENIFMECQFRGGLNFHFKGLEESLRYVSRLSRSMQCYPMEDVLVGDFLFQEFRSDLIKRIVSSLTPDNIHVSVASKTFENMTDRKEKWYGIDYKTTDIPEQTLDKWRNCGVNENFKLPNRNIFMPSNWDLVPREVGNTFSPTLIKNTPRTRLWFKQDDKYLVPKACFMVEFQTPLISSTPLYYCAIDMFSRLMISCLKSNLYEAGLANFSYSICITSQGLKLQIQGYNDKLGSLLKRILHVFNICNITDKVFERRKTNYIGSLEVLMESLPRVQLDLYFSLFLKETSWSNQEIIEAAQELTNAQMKQLVQEVFSNMHIEAFAYGNLTRDQGFELVREAEKGLTKDWKPLPDSEVVRGRCHQMEDGSSLVIERIDRAQPISSVLTYFQCGRQDTRTNALVDLFLHIISEPCFVTLRTQEQLGYSVNSGTRSEFGVLGFEIAVRTSYDPAYVDGRIEAFLDTMENHILDMNQEDFEFHKKCFVYEYGVKFKTLQSSFEFYSSQILSGRYHFDVHTFEAECRKNITKDDLLEFYRTTIARNGRSRKKLSVHISPQSKTQANVVSNAREIQDIREFKSSLGLYPVATQFRDIRSPVL